MKYSDIISIDHTHEYMCPNSQTHTHSSTICTHKVTTVNNNYLCQNIQYILNIPHKYLGDNYAAYFNQSTCTHVLKCHPVNSRICAN